MSKKWVASVAAGLAFVLAAGTFDSAEARRGGGGFRSGGGGHFGARSFGGSRFVARPNFHRGAAFVGPRHFGHRHGRHFRRGIIVGAPLAYGAYYYGYGGCRWLRIRALETGSGYWWARYEACLNGYY
jgi:hypothetical protein